MKLEINKNAYIRVSSTKPCTIVEFAREFLELLDMIGVEDAIWEQDEEKEAKREKLVEDLKNNNSVFPLL